ncbi:hypothetical protein QCA50_010549 [Cerrena zonata]|uniref:non-specific serine/threonine protein kinase n=1 Tax=Cerrena zonata TaxID=2478898 RepID=A0AAW0FYS2_9APHY
MIFRKEHFFRGRDNEDQLLRILKVLGTSSFEKYLEKYGLYLQTENELLLESFSKIPWPCFVNPENRPNVSNEALDLLDKLLRYDHWERVTAAEALAHAYFNNVRLESTPKSAERFSDSGFCST